MTVSSAGVSAPVGVRGRLAPLVRHIPLILFALLCAVALTGLLLYRTDAAYDTLTSLIWSREIAHGHLPDYDFYRAPTPHPLLILIGLPLLVLGTGASTATVVLSVAGLMALVAGTYRLGRLGAGMLGGLAAAAIVATRLDFWWLSSVAYLDIPYAAMIVWAAALEAERPRRGGGVWVLLVLAGLLRPEAWLLIVLYAVWLGWRADARTRLRYAAYAAIGPVIWCITDFIVTGNPVFSLFYTDSLAAELERGKPLWKLPFLMVYYSYVLLKAPVFLLAACGVALAVVRRRRAFLMPAVLVLATWFSYLVIASGGLATVWRYLLLAAVGLAVFAAYALTGWTTLARANRWRMRWAATAGAAVALGIGWTAIHVSPGWIDDELVERAAVRTDLEALFARPDVRAARRCGPVSVPNHKLVPALRWYLDAGANDVIARSDVRRGVQQGGVAIVIDRRVEERPDLNVREAPVDEPKNIQVPPPGFRLAGGNASYGVYLRCP